MRVGLVRCRVIVFALLISVAAAIAAQAAPSDSPDGMWMDLSKVDLNAVPIGCHAYLF